MQDLFFYESVLYVNRILVSKDSIKIDIYNILNYTRILI